VPGRFQNLEQNAAAGAHGRGSGAGQNADQIKHFRQQGGVMAGKLGEALHGAGLHNRTAVFKIRLKGAGGAADFGFGQREPRNQERQVPAQLDFRGLCEQAEKRVFSRSEPGCKQLRAAMRGFFESVRGAAGYSWIRIPEALDELGGFFGLGENQFDDLALAGDAKTRAAGEHGANSLPAWSLPSWGLPLWHDCGYFAMPGGRGRVLLAAPAVKFSSSCAKLAVSLDRKLHLRLDLRLHWPLSRLGPRQKRSAPWRKNW
jgi:hypothetical protein